VFRALFFSISWKVYATSAAVKAVPSLHFTPLWILNEIEVPVEFQEYESASHGV
jgi:hypothetical protein